MVKKVRVIAIPRGAAKKMCSDLNIGRTTLYMALNFFSFSEKAQEIRDKAVNEYNGAEVKKPRWT